MSVCRTVSEILSVKEWRDVETGGRVRSRLLKIAPFDRYDFLLIGHCKYRYDVPFSRYLTLNNRDLEKITEGHSNWYHSKAWVWFPICLS